MNLFIITGVSRGLGKEFGKAVLNREDSLWAIGRSYPKEFDNHINFIFSEGNLLDGIFISNLISQLENYDFSRFNNVFLINNAGTLGDIDKVENLDYENMKDVFELNTFVPILISKGFIKNTSNKRKNIVNISTGAATRPIEEMSLYCSSKSALDMFTKIIALENPMIKTIGISPGMIETDMQLKLRSKGSLENQSIYKKAKEKGKVRSSSFVAEEIIDFLLNNKVESGEIIHINDIM